MKHLWWSIRYFWHMWRLVGNIKSCIYFARVAHLECEDWDVMTPREAVLEELSCWVE
jgi:hypothetical protein